MYLMEMKEVYSQEPDCCSGQTDDHFLEVKIEDGGNGPFLVIKTKRWSMDETDIPLLFSNLRSMLRRAQKTKAEHSSDN